MRPSSTLYWHGQFCLKSQYARYGHGLAWTVFGGFVPVVQASARCQNGATDSYLTDEAFLEDSCRKNHPS